ncbi:hypothetical protein HanIR_Chr10g0483871 [Helianthus annuus]|nr:hypothetical protein HanIR_Chr10g0483871 [Helianthus annuus]
MLAWWMGWQLLWMLLFASSCSDSSLMFQKNKYLLVSSRFALRPGDETKAFGAKWSENDAFQEIARYGTTVPYTGTTAPSLPTSALSASTSIQQPNQTSIQQPNHRNQVTHDRANHSHDRARSISAPDHLVSEIDSITAEHYRLARPGHARARSCYLGNF